MIRLCILGIDLGCMLIVTGVMIGCGGPSSPAIATMAPAASSRFAVSVSGTFQAAGPDRASQRTIYVITDTTTGAEYLAVEGCGTAQLVTVHHGKTTSVEEQ